jgi:hypothetical protein
VPDEQSTRSASQCSWSKLHSSMSLDVGSVIMGLKRESSVGMKPFLQRRPLKEAPHSIKLEIYHLCCKDGG